MPSRFTFNHLVARSWHLLGFAVALGAALIALPATAHATPARGGDLTVAKLLATPPHHASVDRTTARYLKRSARTLKQRKAARKLRTSKRQGATARAAALVQYGQCQYFSSTYRGCVFYDTSWNAFWVEYHSWAGTRWVLAQKWYCPGAGSGCIRVY